MSVGRFRSKMLPSLRQRSVHVWVERQKCVWRYLNERDWAGVGPRMNEQTPVESMRTSMCGCAYGNVSVFCTTVIWTTTNKTTYMYLKKKWKWKWKILKGLLNYNYRSLCNIRSHLWYDHPLPKPFLSLWANMAKHTQEEPFSRLKDQLRWLIRV